MVTVFDGTSNEASSAGGFVLGEISALTGAKEIELWHGVTPTLKEAMG